MVNLFLSGNQVPVIHQPGFQLLWDFHFNFHSVYEGFLLSKEPEAGNLEMYIHLFL